MSRATQDKEVLTRRDALKTLAAVTGAVTLAGLPQNWQTPLVEVGALPAHACVSATPPFAAPGQIIASATWSPAIDGDLWLDIAVGECGDLDFGPGDVVDNGTGPLNVSVSDLEAGTYVIDLDYYGTIPINAAVTVTTEFGTTTFTGTVPASTLAIITRVTLPGGGCGGATFELCEEGGDGDDGEPMGLGRKTR